MALERLPHIILTEPPAGEVFTSTGLRGPKKRIPIRERYSHSDFLSNKLRQAWEASEEEQAVAHVGRRGVYLEFRSDPDADLVTKSLEDMRSKKVRLLNVRKERELIGNEEKTTTYATVFLAHEKKNHFLAKIKEYAEKETEKGQFRNADLVNSIADIRKALLVDSFWQDPKNLIPTDEPEWCEAWLSSDSREVSERFDLLLNREHIESREGIVRFPERAVKVIHATQKQLERLTTLSDDIAEYRRAKDTAAFWTGMENREQAEWVADLLSRSHVDEDQNIAVCILDTGINNGHLLLQPVLDDEDCQTVNPDWGVHDHGTYGHGTLMAGLAAYGDLRKCLASKDVIRLRHCLESVKILPPPPDVNQPNLWGYVTSQGVSRAEIQSPQRKRVLCMAVTASDTRDHGRPTSWSGALDQLASGAEDDVRRLFIVCAGNLADIVSAVDYPNAQLHESAHDPAQAWNALTVGSYTEFDQITESSYEGYSPIAPKNGLSPFSTTSWTWEDEWPVKPEVVMDGGNMAHDGHGFVTECDDLSVLSTFWQPETSHFFPFNMTSASSAQAAWFAAQIQSLYPDFWPETIRALMVHSSDWTDKLKEQFLDDKSKTSYATLLRICGYGVPNLERALYSASNSLTIISQADLQPYDKKEEGNGFRTKEMHLYELPWPKEVLLDLPEGIEVQMRVTLSYYIEPGPGEIGWKDRYRYASHALRFDVNSPGESKGDFLKRINIAAREEDEGHPGTQSASDHWLIGKRGRDKGSMHSDIWQGNPAQLAASNCIAVYPIIGWWRERNHLGRWSRRTRYSLVISITTPEESVDVYTPVANQIGITVPIPVGI